MTTTDERPPVADLGEQARMLWQTSQPKPTAAELAEQFDRSPRWARDRIREARSATGLPPAEVAATAAEVAATAGEMAATDGRPMAATIDRPGPRVAEGGDQVDEHADTGWGLTWWLSVVAVVVVGGVALVMSYDHMRLLADQSGEGWRAYLLPVSVDGLMIAASSVILARQRQRLAAGWLPWAALAAGVAASVAANIAQAGHDLSPMAVDHDRLLMQARVLAAWPPLAALAGVELLMRQLRSQQISGDR
jgi:hypothetical protein